MRAATVEALEMTPAPSNSGGTGGTGGTSPPDKGFKRSPTRKAGGTGGTTPASVADVVANAKAELPEVTVPERPQWRVIEARSRCKESGQTLKPGVWLFSMTSPKGDALPEPVETWVCGPLHIEAQTADSNGNAYGRLLRFRTTRGQWRTWAMPMRTLSGNGEELRGELMDMGLTVNPRQKPLVAQYLQHKEPRRQMLCTDSVGWCGNSFVFPAEVIGPTADDVVFQHDARIGDEHRTAGTLEGWQQEVAALAIDNPLLMVGLSVAFAGPLIQPAHAESGGLHIVGDSAAGKSTIQKAAVSVWGSPEYARSWRATSNGLEGTAALHNDQLLALDEISECDPRQVGAIVYMIGNGQGKQRATRNGSARSVTRWRVAVLSTGERTIGATMEEGGHRQKAGQSVRLLDVPTDRKHGAFDCLHQFPSGQAFADHLQTAVAANYGHAARVFIEALTGSDDDHAAGYAAMRKHSVFTPPGLDQQESRAAARFALMAYAGELAVRYGVVPWPKGAATEAAGVAFESWRSMRGSGRTEHRQVLDAVLHFIERHGDGRFADMPTPGSNSQWAADFEPESIRDRAGWREGEANARVYLFTGGGLREALHGFDFNRALDVLEQYGVLNRGGDGKRAVKRRIGKETPRVYAVSVEALRGVEQ